jgi:hypothetical protein
MSGSLRVISLIILTVFFHVASESKQGILFAMGPRESHFIGVYATAKVIRSMSQIPIEVWCYRFEYPMIAAAALRALESINELQIKILPDPSIGNENSFSNLKSEHKGRSWEFDYLHFASKPLALLTTNFTEVLLLDSDTVLFVAPEYLFSLEQFRSTGTLFLRDKFLV